MAELAADDPVVTIVRVGVEAPSEFGAKAVLLAQSEIVAAVIAHRDTTPGVRRLAQLGYLFELPAGECDALLQAMEHVDSFGLDLDADDDERIDDDE